MSVELVENEAHEAAKTQAHHSVLLVLGWFWDGASLDELKTNLREQAKQDWLADVQHGGIEYAKEVRKCRRQLLCDELIAHEGSVEDAWQYIDQCLPETEETV